MRFSCVFAFTALQASLSQALSWSIDSTLSNGHYTLSFPNNDVTGQPVVKRSYPYKRDGASSISRRQFANETGIVATSRTQDRSLPVSEIVCMKDPETLDPDDYYHSKLALFNYCEHERVRGLRVEFALHGSVAVWVCDWSSFVWQKNPCYDFEYFEAEGYMNETCGADLGAEVQMKRWKKSYGRSTREEGINC